MEDTGKTPGKLLHVTSVEIGSNRDCITRYNEKMQYLKNMAASALKDHVLDFISSLHGLIEANEQEVNQLNNILRTVMSTAQVDEEREAAWIWMNNEVLQLSDEVNAEYVRRFKIDAIMMRNELRFRLPNYEPLEKNLENMYEHPTGFSDIDNVATDLETMANLLTSA